jgi:hypothetical protein
MGSNTVCVCFRADVSCVVFVDRCALPTVRTAGRARCRKSRSQARGRRKSNVSRMPRTRSFRRSEMCSGFGRLVCSKHSASNAGFDAPSSDVRVVRDGCACTAVTDHAAGRTGSMTRAASVAYGKTQVALPRRWYGDGSGTGPGGDRASPKCGCLDVHRVDASAVMMA